MAISIPWPRGTLGGLTRQNIDNRQRTFVPDRNPGQGVTDENYTISNYPDPARLTYLEQNYDRVMNPILQATRPDEEVTGTFLNPIIDSMLAEDLSGYAEDHIRRREDCAKRQAEYQQRLTEILFEMRMIETGITDKTLLNPAETGSATDANTPAGRVYTQGGAA